MLTRNNIKESLPVIVSCFTIFGIVYQHYGSILVAAPSLTQLFAEGDTANDELRKRNRSSQTTKVIFPLQ